jgi:hypothetical protein
MGIRDIQKSVFFRVIGIRLFRHPCVYFMGMRDIQGSVFVRVIGIRRFRHPCVSFMGIRDFHAQHSLRTFGSTVLQTSHLQLHLQQRPAGISF